MSRVTDIIEDRLLSGFSEPVLTALSRRNQALATAALIYMHLKRVQTSKAGPKNRVNVLFLTKAGLTEDMFSCFGNQPEFGLYGLNRRIAKAVFAGFLPRDVDDNNYVSDDPKIEESKQRLRAFWVQVLTRLFRFIKISVIMTGNYSYAAEQELAGAATQMNVPFMALHKECLNTRAFEDFLLEVYKGRKNTFQGRKICLYNKSERRIQQAANVISQDKIIITGMPRLDRIHRLRREMAAGKVVRPKNPGVLFLSFHDKSGLPFIGRKNAAGRETLARELEQLSIGKLAKDCHLAMVTLAKNNPDFTVFIKSKGDYLARAAFIRYFGENFSFPKNLKIIHGGDPLEIFNQSTVVCGFNSTALMEAIAYGKKVVVPKFQEALDKKIIPYIVDMEDAVDYAQSPDDLTKQLESGARNGFDNFIPPADLDVKINKLLDTWVGNSDGNSGKRVREVVWAEALKF